VCSSDLLWSAKRPEKKFSGEKMRVVIASVSHTGTNFCKRLFIDKGWEDCAFNQEPSQGNAYLVGHIRHDDQIERALSLAQKYPLICPFRHPYRVEESWLRQGRGTSRDLVKCFELMFDKFLPLKPYIMPVDSPTREKWLDAMAKGLKLDLKTDWEVMNSKANTYAMELSEFTPSDEIIRFTKEINQFLGQYYGKARKKKRG